MYMCIIDGSESEAERVMSRAVDVAGGTECKRQRKFVFNSLRFFISDQVMSKKTSSGGLGYYWLSARFEGTRYRRC